MRKAQPTTLTNVVLIAELEVPASHLLDGRVVELEPGLRRAVEDVRDVVSAVGAGPAVNEHRLERVLARRGVCKTDPRR